MELFAAGRQLPIAQLGPDFVIFARPVELPACIGEMVMRVDGEEERWTVRLPHGATVEERRVAIFGV